MLRVKPISARRAPEKDSCDEYPHPLLPAQPLGLSQNLFETPGDDLAAVFLTSRDHILELLDLRFQLGDFGLVLLLSLLELFRENLAQFGLDGVPGQIGLGLGKLA